MNYLTVPPKNTPNFIQRNKESVRNKTATNKSKPESAKLASRSAILLPQKKPDLTKSVYKSKSAAGKMNGINVSEGGGSAINLNQDEDNKRFGGSMSRRPGPTPVFKKDHPENFIPTSHSINTSKGTSKTSNLIESNKTAGSIMNKTKEPKEISFAERYMKELDYKLSMDKNLDYRPGNIATEVKSEIAKIVKECDLDIITDPTCPVGHVQLSNKDKIATLEALHERFRIVTCEYNLLPMESDTRRIKLRRKELETELTRIEDGLQVFSSPNVFIKLNK